MSEIQGDPKAIREKLVEIDRDVEALAIAKVAGEVDEAAYDEAIRSLADRRRQLLALLPPPPPAGARWVTAVRAFCDAYLTFDEAR